MPSNPALKKATMETLKAFDGNPVSEEQLGGHIETRYGPKLTTQAIQDMLLFLRDCGLADSREDTFEEATLWWITEAGKQRK